MFLFTDFGMANSQENLKNSAYNPFNVNKHHIVVGPGVERFFKSMNVEHEGRISSKELQQAFQIFQGKHFSDSTCKFIVRLFDLDRNGGLNIREFETLYYYIKQWVCAFNAHDCDKCGFIDEGELNKVLKDMDIHFSSDFIHFLVTRSNSNASRISLDQYLIMCIQIQRFTDEFKKRDLKLSGKVEIAYEDFLEMIMKCL